MNKFFQSAHPNASSTLVSTQQRYDYDPDEWKEDAYLAEAAYTPGKELPGYTIDKEGSSNFFTTYRTPKNKTVVAFSGTHPNPFKSSQFWHDIKSDAELATGLHNMEGKMWFGDQFKESADIVSKMAQKYGTANVRATGHSLGGTKSIFASSKTGVKARGFNPGWSPNTNNRWFKTMDLSNSEAYIVPGDPIAASALLEPKLKTHIIKNEAGLKQLMSNFQTKPMEMAAGTSLTQAASSVHPIIGAAVGAYGAYSVAKDAVKLHGLENFDKKTSTTINSVTPLVHDKPTIQPVPKLKGRTVHSMSMPRVTAVNARPQAKTRRTRNGGRRPGQGDGNFASTI